MIETFTFGLGTGPKAGSSPERLGGKGAGLVMMDANNINVPPGFIIPTEVCALYKKSPQTTMSAILDAIGPHLQALRFKFGYMPLLSVRSGARVSMPGMMDTILNVGLDEGTQAAWGTRLGEQCAIDCKRRLIEMYGSVVRGIGRDQFHGKTAMQSAQVYEKATGEAFPDFQGQLEGAIAAVFQSWDNERAVVYRNLHKIPHDWGTAVTVQAMVFGNMNPQSGTGVLFTRDPDSGANKITGEFLPQAQGEDVVAGSATPLKLIAMQDWNAPVYKALCETVRKLEKMKSYPQDVEFTVQDGELFILQTRNAKRSAKAAVAWAVQMYAEGHIKDASKAAATVAPREFDMASRPVIDPKFKTAASFKGIAACSGVATGIIVRSAADAVKHKGKCILVSNETTPEDLQGMIAANGVLTMTGGMTSHAAVVARSLNKPTVVGLTQALAQFKEGEKVTICGQTGRVWLGVDVPVVLPSADENMIEFRALLRLAANNAPIISADPEELPDYLYIADSLMLSKTEVAARIQKVAKQKHVTVVLDTGRTEVQEFYAMLGIKPHQRAQDIVDECKGQEWFKNVTVLMKGLEAVGVQTLISSLKQLVLAQNGYLIDPVFAKTMEAAKVQVWLASEGIKPGQDKSAGKPLSYAQLTAFCGA